MPSSKRQNAALVGAKTLNGPSGNDKSSTKSAADKAATKVVYPASSAVLGISSKTSVGAVVGETGAGVGLTGTFVGSVGSSVMGFSVGNSVGGSTGNDVVGFFLEFFFGFFL